VRPGVAQVMVRREDHAGRIGGTYHSAASAAVIASGFSQRTCFRAAIAAIA
jgi:hypothetical protein